MLSPHSMHWKRKSKNVLTHLFLFWCLSTCWLLHLLGPNCGLNPLRINPKSLETELFLFLFPPAPQKNSTDKVCCGKSLWPNLVSWGMKIQSRHIFCHHLKSADKSRTKELCFVYQKKYGCWYIPILDIKWAIYCNSVSLFLWWKHFRLLSNIQ